MNTELRNKAWQVLPKEFKEEVKSRYRNALRFNEYAHECVVFRSLFGIHNLTSDAEEEEILIVPRKKVQEMFNKIQKIIPKCEHDRGFRNAGLNILKIFFNSKCLPDRDAHEDNFATKKPQPAEPKNEGTRQGQCVPKNAESGTHSFNRILKDCFRNERRLNIATTIAAGWLACHGMTNPKTIAIDALAVADTLMAEAEKGDSNELRHHILRGW